MNLFLSIFILYIREHIYIANKRWLGARGAQKELKKNCNLVSNLFKYFLLVLQMQIAAYLSFWLEAQTIYSYSPDVYNYITIHKTH